MHLLGWTLNYEMFFYAVFAAAIVLPRRFAVAAVTLVLLALVALGRTPSAAAAVFVLGEFDHLGILLRHGPRARVSRGRAPAACRRMGARDRGVRRLCGDVESAARWAGWRCLFWGLPSAALVAAAVLARATWQPGAAGRFFGLLGDASYSLYLVHPLTFPLVRWTLGRWIDFSGEPWALRRDRVRGGDRRVGRLLSGVREAHHARVAAQAQGRVDVRDDAQKCRIMQNRQG